jgi:hypothetical protein
MTGATHGGRRAGAGRPQSVVKPIRRTVYLDQRHVEMVTRHQKPGSTFSEALRHLIESSCRYD